MSPRMTRVTATACLAACGLAGALRAAPPELKGPDAFAGIGDPKRRSQELFREMGKVLTHPRCINCHPAGDRPRQRDLQPHQPLVVRGPDGHGAPAMRCATCHGAERFGNVPGHPHWHLAPVEMGWEGLTLAQLCAQLKDPDRNGGFGFDALVEHMAEDTLVGTAWDPPAHLEPAPGTQARLGALTRAWVEAGAGCPDS